jgi:diacylglycerol kinase (ATP)
VQLDRSLDLIDCIGRAIEEGCGQVVAAGGDGTVNAIVNALMNIDCGRRPCLAILPAGTANDFAGTLGIPTSLPQAIESLRQGQPRPVDVVRIRGAGFERFYANVAAGGNSVRVSEALTDEVKARWGAFSYLRGALEVLPDMKSYRVNVQIDDEVIPNINCWAVLVANGRTNAGHIEVAPQASVFDGLLDVIIVRDGTVVEMVEIVASKLLGNFLESDQVIFRQARRLQLHAQPIMRFSLDGEVVDQEPVEFEIVPGAIDMVIGGTT